jgi:hypothetical protein
MKLSTENIQFINNYLEHSGVYYYDVRLEMIDHIASELEVEYENATFEEAFKIYMLENKKALLENNKTFKRLANKKLLKQFVKNMSVKKATIFFIIFTLTYKIVFELLGVQLFESLMTTIPFTSMPFLPFAATLFTTFICTTILSSHNINRKPIVLVFAIIVPIIIIPLSRLLPLLEGLIQIEKSRMVSLAIIMSVSTTFVLTLIGSVYKTASGYAKQFKVLT